MSFFQELKRRNVFRVGVSYVLIAWVLLQGADFALDLIGAPNWVIQALSVVVITGLPLALIMAWAFEMTPEGVKKAEDVDPQAEKRRQLGLLHYAIMALAVAAISWYLYQLRPNSEFGEVGLPGSEQLSESGMTAAAGTSSTGTSIAVLPFVNMSDDESQEYFSDGISEELLNVLSRVPGLRVSSRTSSFAFKGVNRNIREIAAILGVNHILEGSVRKGGDKVRITAQLIDTQTDRHIWSDTFDRELDDIFAIQDEISSAIVSALQDALGLQEELSLEVIPVTKNMDAYDLYLQGVSLESVLSVETTRRRVELLQQAVEIDPNFSRAWVELARSLVYLPTWDHALDMQEYNNKASEAGRRALSLIPNDPDAHLAMSEILASQNDWHGWLRELEQAQVLEDGSRPVAVDLASVSSEIWLGLGYLTRALALAEEAVVQRPDDAFSQLIKAMVLMDLGRREEARAHLEQALLLGYAGGAGDQLWEYVEAADLKTAWAATKGMYFQDHEPELLPLLPHLSRITFAAADELEVERRRFWQVVTELGFNREYLLGESSRWGYRLSTEVLVALGEFEMIADQYWGNSPFFWMWSPALKPFRQSEEFKSRVRSSGMLEFWQSTGWPDLCRPLLEDDFECE